MANLIAGLVLTATILAFATLAFWIQARARRRANASSAWPSTHGVVESTQLLSMGDQTTPLIFYTYQVGGKTYRANRLRFGGEVHFFVSDAYRRLAGLKAGDTVTVYYNPENPREAVLHNHGTASNVAATAGWALLILAALLALVVAVSPRVP